MYFPFLVVVPWQPVVCVNQLDTPSVVRLTVSKAERGVITKGEDVEVVGLGSSFKTTLTGIGRRGDILLFHFL
jgi:translation elongation factor EF-Tu-like GTPase